MNNYSPFSCSRCRRLHQLALLEKTKLPPRWSVGQGSFLVVTAVPDEQVFRNYRQVARSDL